MDQVGFFMPQMICTQCLTYGTPRRVTRGNTLIEFGLWLAFGSPCRLWFARRTSARAW